MSTGVTTTTTVEIDWYALGRDLAQRGSITQAALLDGLGAGLADIGTVPAAYQVQYIADAIGNRGLWLIQELANALTLNGEN